MQDNSQEFFINTKAGGILACLTNGKLSKIILNQPTHSARPESGIRPKSINQLDLQLLEYFNGHRKDFHIDFILLGTDFQKEVWTKLLTIPYGKTVTYGKLAAQLGDVKKIRAVANAIARNPIPIVIPCHRVIGARGELTGYVGGLAMKKRLIEIESSRQLGLFK